MRAAADFHLSRVTRAWCLEALEQLRLDAEEHGGPTILCGDILDVAEDVPAAAFLAFRDKLAQFPGEVYVLAGNHDQIGRSTGQTILTALDTATVVTDALLSPHGAMLAYREPGRFSSRLGALGPSDRLFCHQGFKGAYMNAMVRDRDGVLPRETAGRPLVVAGHYHLPHSIGNIIYCGSPFQLSFAEEGHVKSFLRWEEGSPWPTRVPFGTSAPNHYTIRWEPDRGEPSMPAAARPHDKVRVVTSVDRKQARAARDQLKRAGLEEAALITSAADDTSLAADPTLGVWPAVEDYIAKVSGGDARRPSADAVVALAEEEGLWRG